MRGFAKRGSEKAMKIEFRKTGLACHLPEQPTGLIFVREEIAPTTEPAEGVVMEKSAHEEIILPFQQRRLQHSHFGPVAAYFPSATIVFTSTQT
jgi:hypothetical protein